jgi:hypothetical protein
LIEPADAPLEFSRLQYLDLGREKVDVADPRALAPLADAIDRLARMPSRTRRD